MKEISTNDLSKLCCDFGLELAAIQAFMTVESRGNGFLPSGRITILFERHVFYRESGIVPVSKTRPDLSNKFPGGYLGGEKEWDRLNDAIEFHEIGALRSTSWGLGQIMGFNHKLAGYTTVKEMVADFSISEANQIKGMLNFIKSNHSLFNAIKRKEWEEVAKLYNGRNYKKNNYDVKLENAYKLYA